MNPAKDCCRRIRPLLEMAADGLLDAPASGPDKTRLEAHLSGCDPCRELLACEREVTDALAGWSRVCVCVAVENRVMEAVRARASAAPSHGAAMSRIFAARLAACFGFAGIGTLLLEVLLACGIAFLVFRNPKATDLLVTFSLHAGRFIASAVVRILGTLWTVVAPLGRVLVALTKGLAPLSGYGNFAALAFLAALVLLTLFAVYADARRPAPAAGVLP